MTSPESLDWIFPESLHGVIDIEVAHQRLHRALDTVRSGRVTAERAAAELAEDSALALPPLFVQILLEHAETPQVDDRAPARDPGLPQLTFPPKQRAADNEADPETAHFAAWVPAEPDRDPEAAAASATTWTLERASESDLPAVVLSPNRKTEASVRAFKRLRSEDRPITPLARDGVKPGTGPVLAYLPRARELEIAVHLAADGPLCVVEAPGFPVSGWARHARALNLATDETAAAYPAEIHERLERLIGCGHDGWTPEQDAERARQILKDLLREDFDDLEALCAYAVGRGSSAAALKRLGELAVDVGLTGRDDFVGSV